MLFGAAAFRLMWEYVLDVSARGLPTPAALDNVHAARAFFEYALGDDHEACANVLRHFSERVRSDREVALRAVRLDGCALRFVCPPAREDREVVRVAVERTGNALLFVGEWDEELVRSAFRTASTEWIEPLLHRLLPNLELQCEYAARTGAVDVLRYTTLPAMRRAVRHACPSRVERLTDLAVHAMRAVGEPAALYEETKRWVEAVYHPTGRMAAWYASAVSS